MALNILILVAGFVLLIKGADALVEGAASVARNMGVRALVVGLTVVAFGTSAPELVVNVFSATAGAGDLAVGNILGSNLANTLLILGVVAAIAPIKLTQGTVWKEIPFAFLAALLVAIMGADVLLDGSAENSIARIDGLVLLAFFVIFLYYTFGISKVKGKNKEEIEVVSMPKSIFLVIIGIFGLGIGGKLIVDAAITIATLFGVSSHMIGATVVAIGTSLPELVTAGVAALKKHSSIAVGNIIGSNIFNIFFVLATTAVITPLPYTASAAQDALFLIGVSLFLFLTLFFGKRRTVVAWQGYSFLALYAGYIIFSVYRG